MTGFLAAAFRPRNGARPVVTVAEQVDLSTFKITATEQPRVVISCTASGCGYSTAFSVPQSRAGLTVADLAEAVRHHHPYRHEVKP